MSYILDALRKSEQERNTLNLPTATGRYHQAQVVKGHSIRWLFALLFFAAVSAWLMTRPSQPEPMPTTAIDSSSVQSIAIVAETNNRKAEPEPLQVKTAQTLELPEKPEQPLRVQKNHTPQAQSNPEQITSAKPERETVPPETTRVDLSSIPPSLLTDDHAPAVATAHIPERSELPLKQLNALPAISIAGHIYDEKQSGRMVIINGKLRREKQGIGDGLTLEEITTDGVILNHRGIIFRMGVFD